MNRNNRVLGIFHLCYGGVSGTVVDPKIVFSIALKACASGIILAHNHPSGNLELSKADLQITKKLVDAGNLLDIEIRDHIIVTTKRLLQLRG
jgi:DNA repair protein RadC